MRKILRCKILRCKAGSSTVEFAILTSLFLFVFLSVLDFAYFSIYQRQLGEAVGSAVSSAFLNRTSVTFTNIPAYVQSTANLSAATVTVKCNGTATCTNTSRTCACLSAAGTYTATSSCGVSCSGTTATSGYYVTIKASSPYSSMIVPNKFLDGAVIKRTVTMRLQ